MNRTYASIAVLALFAALAVAGCGGGSKSYSGGTSTAGEEGAAAQAGGGRYGEAAAESAPADGGGAASIGTSRNDELGAILVDSKGFTVYDFHKDKGGQSSCYGACAEAWPPVTTDGMPEAADHAMAAKLGTTQRKDGTMQVTYAGWPLYTYVADKQPGEANGNDVTAFGAPWYALKPSGEEPEEGAGS